MTWTSNERLDAEKLRLHPGRLMFVALRNETQSIPSDIFLVQEHKIIWNQIAYDPWGGWEEITPNRYIARVAGRYRATGGVAYDLSSSGTIRGCRWASAIDAYGHSQALPHVTDALPGGNNTEATARPIVVTMGVGDSISLAATHNAAGNLLTASVQDSLHSYMALYWMGPA